MKVVYLDVVRVNYSMSKYSYVLYYVNYGKKDLLTKVKINDKEKFNDSEVINLLTYIQRNVKVKGFELVVRFF